MNKTKHDHNKKIKYLRGRLGGIVSRYRAAARQARDLEKAQLNAWDKLLQAQDALRKMQETQKG